MALEGLPAPLLFEALCDTCKQITPSRLHKGEMIFQPDEDWVSACKMCEIRSRARMEFWPDDSFGNQNCTWIGLLSSDTGIIGPHSRVFLQLNQRMGDQHNRFIEFGVLYQEGQ
jgi:hypothetical protein